MKQLSKKGETKKTETLEVTQNKSVKIKNIFKQRIF